MILYSKFQTTSNLLAMLLAIFLVTLLATGCAQKMEPQPDDAPSVVTQPVTELPLRVKKVQSEGCRTCHRPEANVVAKDFTAIFDQPKLHHPVGVRYPDATTVPDFALPNGEQDGVVFFDRNSNGQPDEDEIMMFGTASDATVECASCHIEHGHIERGDSFSTWKVPARFYLRFENDGSAVCTTCHQY
ncbi:MAG: hypothetical protein R8M11_01180 [Gallionella sp.]